MHSIDRRDLALEVGQRGRWANRANLLSKCERFELSGGEATKVIDDMKKCVSARWRSLVKTHGGVEADVRAIETAFDYPGFEYA